MNVERLNIYRRLRDFKVPATVLDDIFSSKKDSEILIEAFRALKKEGYKEDQAAIEISKMIFKELNIDPDHLEDE
ncbi:MAG: hypothetical protein CMF94_04755 [Candidatus Marinimicrobia bacterium]|nr:hypothetical protein [Candidatus Neomarinimicrobiota bacterium]|tara:strand:- start:1107 stop:1331 length:225 start_codon:yes stop_codon:yes gene_type:complete